MSGSISAGRSLVVLPTYNECENVARMLGSKRALPNAVDVLVVDDQTADGTPALVREFAEGRPDRIWLVERRGERGLGTAHVHGF